MRKKSIIQVALVMVLGTYYGFGNAPAPDDAYLALRNTLESYAGQSVAGTRPVSILDITADPDEWQAIEALVDAYFVQMAEDGFREEYLARLGEQLQPYRIFIGSLRPVGRYHIGRREIHINSLLFSEQANPAYTKSIIYHEKVHQYQNSYAEPEMLKRDQRERYQNKLQEIGAYYQQLRYVLTLGCEKALTLTLRCSLKYGLLENISRYYRAEDEVIAVIRNYIHTSRE